MKLSIGQVSKIFNITKDTLRHYDKMDLLKPEVNKSNGYRYYSREHLAQLAIILYTRDLDISLSDIKLTLEHEDIGEYKELISKQQMLIREKIESLNKKQKQLAKLESILDEYIDFENEYDFSKIHTYEDEITFLRIAIKDLIIFAENNSDLIYINDDIDQIEEECAFSCYKLDEENELIDDEKNIYLKYSGNEEIIDKYINDIEVEKEIVRGKFIKFRFNGTMKEIEEYLFLLDEHFDLNLNENIFIQFDFYIPKKNEENENYFTQMIINLK